MSELLLETFADGLRAPSLGDQFTISGEAEEQLFRVDFWVVHEHDADDRTTGVELVLLVLLSGLLLLCEKVEFASQAVETEALVPKFGEGLSILRLRFCESYHDDSSRSVVLELEFEVD